MEDKEIIELFFARDQKGIAALVEKYGRLCRQVSMNVLGSFEDADECVNDTWLAAWNQIPPRRPTSLAAYVAKITKNLSLKKYRDDRILLAKENASELLKSVSIWSQKLAF